MDMDSTAPRSIGGLLRAERVLGAPRHGANARPFDLWSRDSDLVLRDLVLRKGDTNWASIARAVECDTGMVTAEDCKERWEVLLPTTVCNFLVQWLPIVLRVWYNCSGPAKAGGCGLFYELGDQGQVESYFSGVTSLTSVHYSKNHSLTYTMQLFRSSMYAWKFDQPTQRPLWAKERCLQSSC